MTADAVGGVWTYALELARGLAGQRIEVMLAVLGPAPDEEQREEAAAGPRLSRVTGPGPRVAGPGRPLWTPQPAGALLALERAFRPDLVH